jgi:2-amino-4-hydroxy-6-hydroxymethyldihydropteridine diphosphokinase
MNRAYIGMGSNLGNGKRAIRDAWETLGDVKGISLEGISSPYMTAPVDMTSQHWFTNAVASLQVELAPMDFLATLLEVETFFGRKRSVKNFGYQDRSLDLDLLYYSDVYMDTPELILPHPRIKDRLFVLVPLAELAPDYIDQPSGRKIAEIERLLRERIGTSERNQQEIIKGKWDEQL